MLFCHMQVNGRTLVGLHYKEAIGHLKATSGMVTLSVLQEQVK